MKPTRRDVLRGLALAGAGAAVLPGCGAADRRQPWPDQPWSAPGTLSLTAFPQGAQAGEPTPSTLLACAKVTDPSDVQLHSALFIDGAWRDQPPQIPERNGDFVRAELSGLPSDTSVALCFVTEGGERSMIVAARTTMAPGQTGEIRLILNCCDHQGGAPFYALSNAPAFAPVDAHIHLGDAAYCDGAVTAQEFRDIWAAHLEHEGYRDLFATAAGIYTWDDHEVDNNWDPGELDPELITTARQALFEHVPVPRNPDHPERLWRSLRFGDVAELFMLDCRGERDRQNGRYISPEQLQWLLDGLAASTATWKLVATSVPISRMPPPFTVPVALNDTWLGFDDGAQRRALLDHITQREIPGVLFLSGDYHMPALARVEPDGPASRLLEIIGGPGGSSPNPIGLILEPSEQLLYLDAVRNIMILDLSPDGTGRVRLVDEAQRQRLDASFTLSGDLLSLEAHRLADESG